jgi:hypothetical protein
MTADVYAGDNALTETGDAADRVFAAAFHIQADADVDVICRVANVLRLANRAPTRGSLLNEHDERTTIYVEMEGISLTTAEYLLRKLSQLTCVIASEVKVTGLEPGARPRVLRATPEGVISSD